MGITCALLCKKSDISPEEHIHIRELSCIVAQNASIQLSKVNGMDMLLGAETIREGHKVRINLRDKQRWAAGSDRLDPSISAIATLVDFFGLGQYDYHFLMGASGLAFRIQIPCDVYSSNLPTALNGLNCVAPALNLLPISYDVIPHDGDLRVVRDSINIGIPVLAMSRQVRLIVGYDGEDFLVDVPNPLETHLNPAETDVSEYRIPIKKQSSVDPRNAVLEAFAFAKRAICVGLHNDFIVGTAAHDCWVNDVLREDKFQNVDFRRQDLLQHLNRKMLENLCEARLSAAVFLVMESTLFRPEKKAAARVIARMYEDLVHEVLVPSGIAKVAPSAVSKGADWAPEQRVELANSLQRAKRVDEEAVELLAELI